MVLDTTCVCRAREVVGIITREDLLSGTLDRRIQHSAGQFGTDGTLNSSGVYRRRRGGVGSSRRAGARVRRGNLVRLASQASAGGLYRSSSGTSGGSGGGGGGGGSGSGGASPSGGELSPYSSMEPSPFTRVNRAALASPSFTGPPPQRAASRLATSAFVSNGASDKAPSPRNRAGGADAELGLASSNTAAGIAAAATGGGPSSATAARSVGNGMGLLAPPPPIRTRTAPNRPPEMTPLLGASARQQEEPSATPQGAHALLAMPETALSPSQLEPTSTGFGAAPAGGGGRGAKNRRRGGGLAGLLGGAAGRAQARLLKDKEANQD